MDWSIAYYRALGGSIPAERFLDGCPMKVEAKLLAVLEVVRAAPPPAFSGGWKWEAMHGSMGGYYEVRYTGPGRERFRLFCRLENGTESDLAQLGFDRPHIVVINWDAQAKRAAVQRCRTSQARTRPGRLVRARRPAPRRRLVRCALSQPPGVGETRSAVRLGRSRPAAATA